MSALARTAAICRHISAAAAAPASAEASHTMALNSGQLMPILGLGTFQATAPGEVKTAVKAAVQAGVRLIDCAAGYGNQTEVGEAFAELFAEGVVCREDLFVVSKLFQTHHDWEGDGSRCQDTLAQTLAELQLDYLDLYLMHWPFAFKQVKLEQPPGTPQPLRLDDGSPNPIWDIKMEYVQTWAVMETMVAAGKTKAIGVSNFTEEQLTDLIGKAKIVPAVNQIELHPYLGQSSMLEFCERAGIRVMAYSPLGSSADRSPAKHGTTLLQHPTVAKVAAEVGRSVGQVLIRWSLQRGAISIPKSSNPARIAQNADVLGWSLSEAQMAELLALESDFRYFISYMKKPDNDERWHDGKIEHGDESDIV